MRTLLLALCVIGLTLATTGCQTETSTIWSGAYWKRHFVKIMDDLHDFRVDIDRIVFDLDDRPIEDF